MADTASEHWAFWVSHLTQPTFVYLIQGDAGTPVKIGYAEDLHRRLAELQTGNPQELHVLYVIPGDRALELAFHRHAWRHRVRGEWFEGADETQALFADTAERMVATYNGELPDVYALSGSKHPRKPKREPGDVTITSTTPSPQTDPEIARAQRKRLRTGLVWPSA